MAHLNHGSFGAVPIPVQQAQQRLRDEMDANPVAFFIRGLYERLAATRAELAAFLGADPGATALTANATSATQVVLGSLRFSPGDEVLLTDHGYGAVSLAVQRLARLTGAVPREVEVPLGADDDELLTRITDAVRPGRTRLAIVDHITSPTARLLPVARIAAALRERGVPVLVDGAHAPGMLPLDVPALGVDFWLGNLHKWAFAPRPTAVLVVAPEHRDAIEPLVVSWEHESGFPAAVEYAGTLDYTAWLAAPVGLQVLHGLGLDRLRRHNWAGAGSGQRRVAEALGLDQATLPGPAGPREGDAPEARALSMRLIPLPAGVAEDHDQATALRERITKELGCEVLLHAWRGRGILRLSAQAYNTPAEYDRLADGLPSLLGLAPAPPWRAV
ncbi:MAG: aminotransferase class V-fold PLP-dependent enzyme [Micromonosporaceae bacterium]